MMVLPCSECGGSGERHETLPGGAKVMTSSAGPLPGQECGPRWGETLGLYGLVAV